MKKPVKVKWPIIIRTRRIELRPYKLSDYQAWHTAFTQRKRQQHKYDRGPLPLEQTSRAFYRKLYFRHERLAKHDICYPFGIFDRKTGAHLGVIDISTICRDWYQWASLGYVIHNTYQGRGFGKEAARAAIQVAFRKLGYKRVEASIYPDNRPSIRLAKALGMNREGIRREYIYDHKKWEDHVVYALSLIHI